LEADQDEYWWYYKITGPLCNESGQYFDRDLAIKQAKGKIDEARFSNW
jgi:hypothetical protein